jgi:hypothetical protein
MQKEKKTAQELPDMILIVSSGSPLALADRLQPALNMEKALLPHDSPAPSAHSYERSEIRLDLARGIFRGVF